MSLIIMVKLIILFMFATLILYTNGSSMLTDQKSKASKNVLYSRNGNCADDLRQLLNQETLIRMSLSKNVHTLMNTVVELKEKQMKTESEFIDLRKEVDNLKQHNKQLKQENNAKNREIKQLKQHYANIQKELIKVNQTYKETKKSISQIAGNQKVFEVKQRQKDFKKNTSDVLKDLKIELRYMSVTLLDLNKHFLEIDKNIPQLVASNIKHITGHLNKSFEDLAFSLTNFKAEQKVIVSAITESEVFRSNFSKLTTDSIRQMKEEIHQTHDTQLKQAAKLSTLEFRVNIISNAHLQQTAKLSSLESNVSILSNAQLNQSAKLSSLELRVKNSNRRRVGFTAGMVSGSSSWSSGTLVFPKIIYQIGGGYNNGSGVFTAPVGGNYVFYVNIVPYGSYSVYVDIVLNGHSKVRTCSSHSGGSAYQVGTNMVLMHLKQGDNVWVKHFSGQGYETYSTAPLTTFSGFLL